MTDQAYASMWTNPNSISSLAKLPELSQSSIDMFATTGKYVKEVKELDRAQYLPSFEYAQKCIREYLDGHGPQHVSFIVDLDEDEFVLGYYPIVKGFMNPDTTKSREEQLANKVIVYYVRRGKNQKIAMVAINFGPSEFMNKTLEKAIDFVEKFITIDGFLIKHSKYCHTCGKFGDGTKREPDLLHCPCKYPDLRYCSKKCSKADWPRHKAQHVERMLALTQGASESVAEPAEMEADELGGATRAAEAAKEAASVEAAIQRLAVAPPSTQNVCAHCGAPATQKCGTCKAVFYCCKACQNNDWKKHKKQCA